ncbi:hypothetical protein [Aestuariivivens sediminis]|uniref:hypothetical protein n=1 Tax=Aestuariivivens sediminis TaxID=2913557 RepID=UPI001F5857C4|nr:hypothetical protein [Aestuariivivens sediminis]
MKSSLIRVLFLLIGLGLAAFRCNDNEDQTYNTELAGLNELKTQIQNLAESAVCDNDTTCKFIAFGSKPCGGPWSYLVYSTSIDTDQIENLVAAFNEKENLFNAKWGVASDCALTQPPRDVICENNRCVAVYSQ